MPTARNCPDCLREVDEVGITGELLRLKAERREISEVLTLIP